MEFAAPVDYVEPGSYKKEEDMQVDEEEFHEPTGFVAFRGEGNRLDGKKKKEPGPSESPVASPRTPRIPRGIPDYDHPYGLIRFDRSVKPISDRTNDEDKESDEQQQQQSKDKGFERFQGQGHQLKKSKK